MKIIKIAFYMLIIISSVLLVLIKTGSYGFYFVGTDSMNPHVKRGSAILIDKTINSSELKQGDVISFIYKGTDTILTHRIVEARVFGNNHLYYTKGDANMFKDPLPVSESEVDGRLLLIIPHALPVAKFFVQPAVLVLLVYLPAGIYLGSEVNRIRAAVLSMISRT